MNEWVWRLGIAVLGPFFGTFIATFAASWPRAPKPRVGRSRCSRCASVIPFGSMLPMLSYMSKRGRRECCGGRIPRVYPVGEVGGLALGLAVAAQPDFTSACLLFATGSGLLFAALVDMRRYSIPWASVLVLTATLGVELVFRATDAPARLWTVAVVFLIFSVLRWLGPRRGRAAVGWGDGILAALIGGMVGPLWAAWVVAAAAIAALCVQTARGGSAASPFGAYLAVSGFLFAALQPFI